jgi:hypothetical protein
MELSVHWIWRAVILINGVSVTLEGAARKRYPPEQTTSLDA